MRPERLIETNQGILSRRARFTESCPLKGSANAVQARPPAIEGADELRFSACPYSAGQHGELQVGAACVEVGAPLLNHVRPCKPQFLLIKRPNFPLRRRERWTASMSSTKLSKRKPANVRTPSRWFAITNG